MGRSLRLFVGAWFLGTVVGVAGTLPTSMLGGGLALALGFAVLYVGVHLRIDRRFSDIGPWTGALLANAPPVAVFVFGGPIGQIGTPTCVGTSLVLAALRADAGCEVMSVPGLPLGSRTHLACIAFSPIDWLEGELATRL